MKIAIGSDHHGFEMKEWLKKQTKFADHAVTWLDVGTRDWQRTDYPIYANLVCAAIQEGKADRGILICGTGVGMAIAANRYKGMYAGLAWNTDVARLCVEHDNANILVLPSDYISNDKAIEMVAAWLNATFQGDRYRARIAMIDTVSCE